MHPEPVEGIDITSCFDKLSMTKPAIFDFLRLHQFYFFSQVADDPSNAFFVDYLIG
jgi:hypothetical protein